jgi:hypothetical protein
MRKMSLIFNYITAVVICQGLAFSTGVMAISDVQKDAISDHCEPIKESLKTVQRNDARARTYLGGRYETILSKYITPLNVRLVENNLSEVSLIENQTNFAKAKSTFAADYVGYQQNLEELIMVDCKTEPEKFYEKLISVRGKRKIVSQDVARLRNLAANQVKLVNELKGKIK